MANRYDSCPSCGGFKRTVANRCKRCWRQPQNVKFERKIDWDRANGVWLAEFRGLFMGEGSAMIVRNGVSFGPQLVIRLRDDDSPMIEEIQSILGGRILWSKRTNPKHGNMVTWLTTGVDHCLQICDLLIAGLLPAKKVSDIVQVRDFCAWRLQQGRYLGEGGRIEAKRRMVALQESRQYVKLPSG